MADRPCYLRAPARGLRASRRGEKIGGSLIYDYRGLAKFAKGKTMRRYLVTLLPLLLALISYSCSNPAANKPQATVSNAAPEKATAPAAGNEHLTNSPENSKVEFVASKVTRTHNG